MFRPIEQFGNRVAAGTGGVAPIGVLASAGKVIAFVAAPMLIVTVCGVAAA